MNHKIKRIPMQISAIYKKSFDDAYDQLNEKQREAVNTIEGPVLVLAGPGTGKTQILAVRIGKILLQTDILPDNILCLTYTDAGTIAMRKRLTQFIGPDAHRVNIYTFHAFCNDIIKANLDYFGIRELEPITELENINLLENIFDELPIQHPLKKLKGGLYDPVARLMNLFKMMKQEAWDENIVLSAIDTYLRDIPTRDEFIYKKANSKTGVKAGDLKQKAIDAENDRMEKLAAAAKLFPVYTTAMREMGRYDFSDMILWVIKAFKDPSNAGVNMLLTYQERYQYVLVDEFQDTNGAQSEILNLLISFWDVPNVFAVGDDDQSIYEFQGARVKNILDFYNAFSSSIEVVVLTENYRSNQSILDAAKVVIEHNGDRLINHIAGLSKQLIASNPARQIKTEPRILEYENTLQEQAGILMEVEKLRDAGVALEEIAIIYPTNAQAENLISAFEKRGIQYQVNKKINILILPIVKQVITLLQYLSEESGKPHKAEHLLFEIMHYPYFNIHPHDIAAMSAWIGSKRSPLITWRSVISEPATLAQIKLKDHESIINFEKKLTHWLQETHNLTLQILFEKILNESGLLKYILNGNQRIWNLEVITTLFDHIKAEGMHIPGISIKDFLAILDQMEIHKINISVQKSISHVGGVNFTTAHSAKGLEFEYVFLLGSNADKWEKSRGSSQNYALPDTLTFTDDDNKEESRRRLFYVALTRAKQHLNVSYASHKADGKNFEVSQYVTELSGGAQLPIIRALIDTETLVEYKITELSETAPVVIDLFDKEYIAKQVEHFTMSASSLNSYLSCPLQFYFQRIVKVPAAKNDSMAFGTAVHYALRRMFEKMKESEDKVFPGMPIVLTDFVYEMKRNEDSFTEKQFQNRLDLGKQILTEYYNNYKDNFNKNVLTEYPIRNIEMDGIPLTGVFDKLEFDGDNVNVVDYKTGSVKYSEDKLRSPDQKNVNGGDYWRQIMFYKILMDAQKYKPWVMVSGEIDYLEKSDEKQFVKHKFQIVQDEVDTVKAQIRDTYQKIKNLEFTQGCGKEDCEWCNFIRDIKQR